MTKRYFLASIPNENNVAQLKDDEHYHLKTVMRKSKDAIIEVFDGKGCFAKAKVDKIEKNSTHVTILDIQQEKKKGYKTTLFQALIKPQKLEWIVEKVTEIGVDEVIFFPSSRSDVKMLSLEKFKRLETIVLNACKQSYRNVFTQIKQVESLENAMELCPFGVLGTLEPASFHLKKTQDIGIWVGPEGGFDPNEEAKLKVKYHPLHLHHYVLKAETAAICLSSFIENACLNPQS